MENGILVEKKLKRNANVENGTEQADTTDTQNSAAASEEGKISSPFKTKKSKWHAHNIAEYFFFNEQGQLEVS